MGTSNTVVRAANFTASIGVNTHLSYTDGAYANVANVQADLAYLGISVIRDGMPNPNGGIPSYNQVSALETLAAGGIKFDLVVEPGSSAIAQAEQEIQLLDNAVPNSVTAVEGPNEINNYPVSYNGLTGQAAATAFQSDLDAAINGSTATSGIEVYNFTGGLTSPILVGGAVTRNGDGSYTLTNGQLAFRVTLPTGVSTVTMTYTGTDKTNPASALFGWPGQNQQEAQVYSKTGTITYTYNNTSGAPKTLYAAFMDIGDTYTLTGVKVTGPGSTTNLATFDPNLSLAGQADAANIHIYPTHGGAIGPVITAAYQNAYFSTGSSARVITETGYDTDPNDPNGVSQLVQAQQTVSGLLEAYKAGVATTYLYELLDEKADPKNTNSQMHFGLFNNNNTPKLAAVALHNLTSLLADTASSAGSFTTTPLSDTLTGGSAADQSLVLEKSDGTYDVALWNDNFAGTGTTDQVTLALGGTYQNVEVYDVVTGAETTLSNVAQVTLALGGDDMLVEIDPNAVNLSSAMGFLHATAAAITPAITAALAPVVSMPTAWVPSTTTLQVPAAQVLAAAIGLGQTSAVSGFLASPAGHHA